MSAVALSHRSESVTPATAPALAPEHLLLQQTLPYAGSVTPTQAWELVAQQAAVLVDVRTAEERRFVGYIPGSVHTPWLLGTAMQTNPRFLRELEAKVSKDTPVLLLCRRGARSAAGAAAAATRAGFKHAYSVVEGFEGDLDESRQRGNRNGWRFRALPWVQD